MADAIYVVRAGKNAAYIEDFLKGGFVALGWGEAGPISQNTPKSEIIEKISATYPSSKAGSWGVAASQIYRYLNEVAIGDRVLTYDPGQRLYFLGEVTSKPEWKDQHLPRVRTVQWTRKVPRDVLSVATRNSLGSIATLFQVSGEVAKEILSKSVAMDSELPASDGQPVSEADETTESDLLEDAASRSDEFIEDRISKLDWDELQELVGAILRAMGYRTQVAAKGADRGVDIFASPDGIGLEEPRIFVEVKHRIGTAMGSQEIRAFLGGRQPGDRCLYVSTGGFTKDARYEADRSTVPIRLLTLPDLRELLVTHYDRLDSTGSSLVPLRKLYWPID